jgi:hypothetical protein
MGLIGGAFLESFIHGWMDGWMDGYPWRSFPFFLVWRYVMGWHREEDLQGSVYIEWLCTHVYVCVWG